MTATARESVAGDELPRIEVNWPGLEMIAGTTTRALNFGRSTDDPADRVDRAHRTVRAWAAGSFDIIVGSSQVHGTRLFRADALAVPEEDRRAPCALRVAEYDGFYTAAAGILLTVGVADCVPAFLVAPEAGAVALLHAGWRGVAAGIVPAAIAELRRAYAAEPAGLVAYWGPAIGACCYPVGEEVVEAIGSTAAGEGMDAWVHRESLHRAEDGPHVDLRAALTLQAEACGLPREAITASTLCTSCEAALLHSYRRERGGGGRMLAFAGIPRRSA